MLPVYHETSTPTGRQQLRHRVRPHFVEGVGLSQGSRSVEVGPWTVDLDSYPAIASYVDVHHGILLSSLDLMHTRIRAPYITLDGFRFWTYHKTRLSGFRKLFGMQDIETGFAEFDDDFVLRGTNEDHARTLIQNWRIRGLLIANPAVHLFVGRDQPRSGSSAEEDVQELCLEVPHDVKDLDEMGSLCDLFEETLDCLFLIGSAAAESPKLVAS